ncbi:MAG: hypothetical protein KAS32_27825 [Candidatus Peribacteraceae bacterium]|nr:hypothetical protein [Candidatus Peribacteraceae bacterium]
MARVSGYGGSVNVGGVVAGIREWSIDYNAEALNSSGYDTGRPKAFWPGQTEWSGSFNGPKDGIPVAIGALVAGATFLESAVALQVWTGDIYVTGISPSSSVDGLVMYNYTFQGTGALTPAGA